ncbi:MAG TPA: hypothetical protein VN238_13910 [Solirubrobacteraceae bacterium]|nr:hypothetical protein [Solirubrobacteraceae bacterium]
MNDRFEEQSRVPVEVRPLVPGGALRPTVTSDELELAGESGDRQTPYGVNVASLVILDLDDDRVVNYVEVMFRPELWTEVETLPRLRRGRSGTIAIPGARPEIYVEEASPRVEFCRATREALVYLEPIEPSATTVRLSPLCAAVINGDYLGGFLVDLTTEMDWSE